MTSTAVMSEKKVFRARVLDPTKKLQVRFRQKCRTQSPKIKRAVAVPPSGMEKDEEMESHLQRAIYAQKATSAGVVVENHVIPTPKVSKIDEDLYERIYKRKNGRSKKMVVFRDFISFFLNQSVYDADSEDEEWLNTKPNIPIDHFEQIMVKLELSSQPDIIIQPSEAKALLQRYDSQIVDDVYDYWLHKRRQIASNASRYNVLMPRLNTEVRRDDKTVNPYLAFRRRLDKVQTRKKQKTEIQTYEKLLRLNYSMKRSIALVEMMKQREKAKLALVDIGEAVFDQQCRAEDVENRELDRVLSDVAAQLATTKFSVPEVPPAKKKAAVLTSPPAPSSSSSSSSLDASENGKSTFSSMWTRPKYSQRRKIRPTKNKSTTFSFNDENVVDEAWLRRNDDLWNRITPTTAASLGVSASLAAANTPSSFASSSNAEVMSLIAKYDVNSSVDGRYHFTRKFGCQYRAPTALTLDAERCNAVELPSTSAVGEPSQNKSSANGERIPQRESDGRSLRPFVSNGEEKFVSVKLRCDDDSDDDAITFGWPLLRRNRLVLDDYHHSGGFCIVNNNDDDDWLCGPADGADAIRSSQLPPPAVAARKRDNSGGNAFGFIRRRIGRGGRVIFDLKC